MNKKIETKLVDVLKNHFKEVEKYDYLTIKLIYTRSGSKQVFPIYSIGNKLIDSEITCPRNSEYFMLSSSFDETFSTENYNNVEFKIYPDGSYESRYWWDDEKAMADKLSREEVFYQWLNDRLILDIFAFEKEQGLLKYEFYDDENHYESSWDEGKFEFSFVKGELSYKIFLEKDGVQRELPIPLKTNVLKEIKEHYQITNTELNTVWEKWNKLTIRSPHNDIPYPDYKNYVFYEYEELTS